MSPGVEGRVDSEAFTYSSSKKVREALADVFSPLGGDIVAKGQWDANSM